MHKIEYDGHYYKIENKNKIQWFCRDLFELFTPSNMHILTKTGSYTGNIKVVPGRSMYVYRVEGGVFICCDKMNKNSYAKNISILMEQVKIEHTTIVLLIFLFIVD